MELKVQFIMDIEDDGYTLEQLTDDVSTYLLNVLLESGVGVKEIKVARAKDGEQL